MKPLHYYFVGTGSWFLVWGIQSVVFAWLVTIILDETPEKVGFAQMALLLPSMLFMLLGGSLADQFGGRRLAITGHLFAAVAPLFLTVVVIADALTYGTIIIFAVIMGIAQAMITPARDGLLPHLAEGAIQRRVIQASMIQFGIQMVGFATASQADRFGAPVILMIQCGVLLLGSAAYFKLQVPFTSPKRPDPSDGPVPGIMGQVRDSILVGFRSVKRSPYMRMVVFQNCAMGIFFMGSYMVTLPLVVRDVYAGTSMQLAWLNIGNSLGLVITTMVLLRLGDVYRQGRALLIAQGVGSFALAGAGLGLGFPSLVVFIFFWGMCGGVAMTMAPNHHAGAIATGPARPNDGFLLIFLHGIRSDWRPALGLPARLARTHRGTAAPSICMVTVVIVVSLASSLWSLDGKPRPE
ncbi:MAG: MFS transporter [Gammaproteobacteria bacterium]|nr:MFS transporter [Gammaproteobacteria bacterium]